MWLCTVCSGVQGSVKLVTDQICKHQVASRVRPETNGPTNKPAANCNAGLQCSLNKLKVAKVRHSAIWYASALPLYVPDSVPGVPGACRSTLCSLSGSS